MRGSPPTPFTPAKAGAHKHRPLEYGPGVTAEIANEPKWMLEIRCMGLSASAGDHQRRVEDA